MENICPEKGRIERKPHGMAVEIVRPPQVAFLTNKETPGSLQLTENIYQ